MNNPLQIPRRIGDCNWLTGARQHPIQFNEERQISLLRLGLAGATLVGAVALVALIGIAAGGGLGSGLGLTLGCTLASVGLIGSGALFWVLFMGKPIVPLSERPATD